MRKKSKRLSKEDKKSTMALQRASGYIRFYIVDNGAYNPFCELYIDRPRIGLHVSRSSLGFTRPRIIRIVSSRISSASVHTRYQHLSADIVSL